MEASKPSSSLDGANNRKRDRYQSSGPYDRSNKMQRKQGGYHDNRSKNEAVVTDFGKYEQIFSELRAEMDTNTYKRERLIQASRDITLASKGCIFDLHRVSTLLLDASQTASQPQSLGAYPRDEHPEESRTAYAKLEDIIKSILERLAVELRAKPLEYFQFHRSFSPCIQEFLEAFLFWHYLNYQQLVPLSVVQAIFDSVSDEVFVAESIEYQNALQQAQQQERNNTKNEEVERQDDGRLPEECRSEPRQPSVLEPPQKRGFLITITDYLLAVGDLTGELMRVAVNSVTSTHDPRRPQSLLVFLRNLYSHYSVYSGGRKVPAGSNPREFVKKSEEMRRSMEKVEKVCYALSVRKSELGNLLDDTQIQKLIADQMANADAEEPQEVS